MSFSSMTRSRHSGSPELRPGPSAPNPEPYHHRISPDAAPIAHPRAFDNWEAPHHPSQRGITSHSSHSSRDPTPLPPWEYGVSPRYSYSAYTGDSRPHEFQEPRALQHPVPYVAAGRERHSVAPYPPLHYSESPTPNVLVGPHTLYHHPSPHFPPPLHFISESRTYTPPPISSIRTASEEPTARKKRKRADAKQLQVLNDAYARSSFPSTEERLRIAEHLEMSARSVQIWFQNKRQSTKQTNRQSTGGQSRGSHGAGPPPGPISEVPSHFAPQRPTRENERGRRPSIRRGV